MWESLPDLAVLLILFDVREEGHSNSVGSGLALIQEAPTHFSMP